MTLVAFYGPCKGKRRIMNAYKDTDLQELV